MKIAAILILALGSTPLAGQDPNLHFDVASVKPSDPAPANQNQNFMRLMGGPGSNDPEHLRYVRVPMLQLLARSFQIQADQIAGPDWIKTNDAQERFDITANLPGNATHEQMGAMMINLLKERFHFAWHVEKKDFDVYELVIAKDGSKLKAAEVPGTSPEIKEGPMHIDKGSDGFPILPAGSTIAEGAGSNGGQMFMMLQGFKGFQLVTSGPRIGMGFTRFTLRMITIDQLIGFAQFYMGSGHVVDRTGLTGTYDVKVAFGAGTPQAGANADEASEPAPDVMSAFEKQLGLRFQKTKAPLDVIVVDHIDKTPTEN